MEIWSQLNTCVSAFAESVVSYCFVTGVLLERSEVAGVLDMQALLHSARWPALVHLALWC